MAVQNTFANKISEFIRMIFILFSVLGIYFLNIGTLENYSFAWLIGLYIGIFFIIGLFYKKYYKTYLKNEKILWNKKLFKEIFLYAIVVCLGAQAGTLLSQMDMQMVTYFLGTQDAGYYTNYVSIISIPFMLIGPIFAFLFPVVSELHSQGASQKIQDVKKFFVKIFLAIGLMFNIFFFVFAREIAFILFGERYLISGQILQFSILFLIFNFLLQINFNIMAGVGKVKERVKILLIAIAFNAIGNFVFIHWIGVAGAALATAFGWVLIFVLSEIFLGKEYKILLDFKNLFKNIVLLGVGGFLFHFFGIPFFENLTRFESFGLLFLFSLIWFGFFVGINYSMFKSFILEVKKLKGKK
ncbi:polysaccharide biosynthesis C-terminal domain-containing protein [Candidatus Gracilibacteria bacterium]|nr:polysaccharide biosynthesis C-terminal domain-containing protein [Candidatus Gracilibacteria bacterium]